MLAPHLGERQTACAENSHLVRFALETGPSRDCVSDTDRSSTAREGPYVRGPDRIRDRGVRHTFGDDVMATAMVGRLIHAAAILSLNG